MFAVGVKTHRYARLQVHVPRQRHVLRARSLRLRVGCSRGCLFVAYAKIRIKGVKGPVKAQSRVYRRDRRGRSTVTIRLPRHAQARIAKALRHHDRVTAFLYAAIVDPTGKVEHHTNGAKLHIRG